MAITLSQETQEMLEKRMQQVGASDADELVQALLENAAEVFDYDDLDPETRAAIEDGESEIDRGLGIPWEEVRAELFAKFGRK